MTDDTTVNSYKNLQQLQPDSPPVMNSQSTTSDDDNAAKSLFHNFILFSLFYSIAHATVDSVLAFSAAELGTSIGSKAGFTLYLVYAFSCLLIAKPVLRLLKPKRSVTVGLWCLLIYVGSFYTAVLCPSVALFIFVLGAAISGIGSGILWTAQSSYYAINSKLYSMCSRFSQAHSINNFAAIFAVFYLSCETGFKLIATLIFFIEEVPSYTIIYHHIHSYTIIYHRIVQRRSILMALHCFQSVHDRCVCGLARLPVLHLTLGRG